MYMYLPVYYMNIFDLRLHYFFFNIYCKLYPVRTTPQFQISNRIAFHFYSGLNAYLCFWIQTTSW